MAENKNRTNSATGCRTSSGKHRSGIEIMFRLLGLLGHLKYIIILAVLGGYVGNTCAIAVTTLGACCVAKIVDPSFIGLPLGGLIGLTILAGILRGLLRFIEQYNNHYIAFKLLAALRDRIFGALRILAPAKLEGKQKGAIISMLTSDVETLEVFYAHTISPIMIAILVDGTAAILITRIGHPMLGLTALAAYLVIGIAVPFISNSLLRQEGQAYRKQFSDSSSYFLDSIKGIRDIVLNGQQGARGKALDSQSDFMNGRTIAIREKSAFSGALSNLIVSLTILGSTAVGIHLVQTGSITPAHMIVALVLLFSSFGPVLSLAALPSNLTQTFASGDRILDFMEEKPVVIENEAGDNFAFEELSVYNLTFSYKTDDSEPVLENISLKIRKGSITGLVGPSGCGKSTLLKMMLRFYDPDSGCIRYNGLDLRQIRTASLHENVVMVSQDTWLFDDTILNNLRFVNPSASMEDVREACRKAAIDEFISSLPDGYDTETGLLGDSLSAGEKQRIGLARAFLSGAPLILLDEVTSNVDAINEGLILKSLQDAAGEKTIVLVSHRDSTMSICDNIFHMEGGRLVPDHGPAQPEKGSEPKTSAGSDAGKKNESGNGSDAGSRNGSETERRTRHKTETEADFSSREYRQWAKEKDLIPVMIRMYCHGNHHTKGSDICADCQELTEYALMRLGKCPFKKNKQFCSFCRIHCYKPEYREKIKAVMKYSGPRMLPTHPVFSISHVVQMIRYKKAHKDK